MALGLILSSSDFYVLNENVGSHPATNFVGGAYGEALLNSSLSSPLTSSGDFARSITAAPAGAEAFGAWYITSSVDGSLYSGSISTSKAYSMRAWFRFKTITDSRGCGLGLNFMGQTNAYATHGSDPRHYHPGGYTLLLSGMKQDGANGTSFSFPQLYLGTNKVSGAVASGPSFPPVQCSGGASNNYAQDTWHRVRLDMIPVGSAGVTLNAYTSSAGDVQSGNEVWEQVGTKFVDAADSVYIDPSLPENAMGFYVWRDGQDNNGGSSKVIIDQFEILVEDL